MRIDIPAPPALDKAHTDLKKATQQFEGYFLHQLLTEMRKTVPDDNLLADDGNSKQIFQDMMDQMYDQLAPSLGPTLLGKTADNKQ